MNYEHEVWNKYYLKDISQSEADVSSVSFL